MKLEKNGDSSEKNEKLGISKFKGVEDEGVQKTSQKFSFPELFSKISLTFFIILSYFGLGTSIMIVGISIIDLVDFLESDEVTVSYILTFKGLGIAIGGLIVGFLSNLSMKFTHSNKIYDISLLKIYFVGYVLILIPMYLTPITPILWLIYFYNFLSGFGSQFLLIIGTVLINIIWNDVSTKLCNSLVNALHFSVVIGTFLCSFFSSFIFSFNLSSKSNLAILYWVCATILTFSVFIIVFKSPEKRSKSSMIEKKDTNMKNQKKISKIKKTKKFCEIILRWIFIFLLSCVMLLYLATDASYVNLLPLYATKKFKDTINKSMASIISSLLLFCACFGRMLSMGLSYIIPSTYILIFDFSVIWVVFFAYQFWQNEIMFWIFSAILGFCFSTVFGAMSILPKDFGLNLSGFELSVLMFPVGFGFMLPTFSTFMMDIWIINAYFHIGFIYISIVIVLFIVVLILGCLMKRSKTKIIPKVKKEDDLKENSSLLYDIVKDDVNKLEDHEKTLEKGKYIGINKNIICFFYIEAFEFVIFDVGQSKVVLKERVENISNIVIKKKEKFVEVTLKCNWNDDDVFEMFLYGVEKGMEFVNQLKQTVESVPPEDNGHVEENGPNEGEVSGENGNEDGNEIEKKTREIPKRVDEVFEGQFNRKEISFLFDDEYLIVGEFEKIKYNRISSVSKSRNKLDGSYTFSVELDEKEERKYILKERVNRFQELLLERCVPDSSSSSSGSDNDEG